VGWSDKRPIRIAIRGFRVCLGGTCADKNLGGVFDIWSTGDRSVGMIGVPRSMERGVEVEAAATRIEKLSCVNPGRRELI
jgi:hypothetical protein